jgi:putative ABC transport system ATP-binding protein
LEGWHDRWQFVPSGCGCAPEVGGNQSERNIKLSDSNAESASIRQKQSSANALIELIGVSRLYDAGCVYALDNVSLAIRRGEFLAVVGPSGSGKTTLLNIMSGLDKPTTGTVLFNGVTTAEAGDWSRLRAFEIGFIFQSFQLLPAFTALENVQIPMFGTKRNPRERAQYARGLLDKVGLSSKISRRPDELSSGEKQRVAIARSLANEPSILMADEPTGNLDSKNAAAVMDLLVHLRQAQGLTLVVVTHNAAVARNADRSVEFMDGRIVFTTERPPQ